jgi:hypothetical protein
MHHWPGAKGKFPGSDVKDFRAGQLATGVPDSKVWLDYANFMRSDHVRFWFGNERNRTTSFKSILIMDTG